MAFQVFATVTGAKQGAFHGESTRKGFEGKIRVIGISYGVAVPHDLSSGQATTKRVQKPITFSIEWEGCSPQFFSAAYTNEALATVVFEYYTQAADGTVRLDHTVKVSKANISELTDSYSLTTLGTPDGRDVQTIAINFQSIEITSDISGETAADEFRAYV